VVILYAAACTTYQDGRDRVINLTITKDCMPGLIQGTVHVRLNELPPRSGRLSYESLLRVLEMQHRPVSDSQVSKTIKQSAVMPKRYNTCFFAGIPIGLFQVDRRSETIH
jgi:hypothetical protein